MACDHDGFHTFRSQYDGDLGVLVYYWVCERCGSSLEEAWRESYRPRFVPYQGPRPLTPSADPAS